MTRDKYIACFWVFFSAYVMITTMIRVVPKIERWDAGVLSAVCLITWLYIILHELERYYEKQKEHRRAILRERLNEHDR